MGRIFYGVQGDARGHVSRALVVAQELPHHEFLYVGRGKVQILKERGYRVEEIPSFSTIIQDNRVDFTATLTDAIRGLVRLGPAIKRVRELIKEFDPQLIISDYECITPRAAKLMGRPCVSLGNEHLLTQCIYDPPPGQRLSRYLTSFFIRFVFSASSHYLIPSFHPLPPIDQARTELFPPLIKPKVMELQPTEGDYALVYLRGYYLSKLIKLLRGRKRRFVIYGMGEKAPEGNLQFKKTSEDKFLADLAACRYVVANGGLSLISEALYLGKPMLCLPVQFLYEQFCNAYFLAQHEFGQYYLGNNGCREDIINTFEDRVEHYRARIKEYNFFGNKLIAARLEGLMRS
jgi:uncharacterized protein (TIGR00661 family)